MFFLYDISISLMAFGMKIASLFNEKVKKGVAGRRDSLKNVQQALAKDDRVIWMHAASLGEYEQGLPVLERLKIQYPDYKILVSFFSPSGYENVVKKKHIADAICYLPFDKKYNPAVCKLISDRSFFYCKVRFLVSIIGSAEPKEYTSLCGFSIVL